MGKMAGIVYTKKNKVIYSIVHDDDDWRLLDGTHVPPGHLILIVERELLKPVDGRPSLHIARDLVCKRHDLTELPDALCAVVDDNGVVVDLVQADHEVHTHEKGRLIPHKTARIGDMLGAM